MFLYSKETERKSAQPKRNRMRDKHAVPAGRNDNGNTVIQRATWIEYSNYYQMQQGRYRQHPVRAYAPLPGGAFLMADNANMDNQSVITDVNHARVSMSQWEKAHASRHPIGGLVQNICNHHVPYYRIYANIRSQYLMNSTVNNAMNNLNNVINNLNALGGPGFIPQIQYVGHDQGMSQEFDDAIANIANYPSNLFYSRFHSGDGGGRLVDYPLSAPVNIPANYIQDPVLNAYRGALTAHGI